MKKKLLLLLFLSGFLSLNGFSQACPDASIYDSTHRVYCSGNTIQLTCETPAVLLSPKVFAPGASDSYVVESIPYAPPYAFNSGIQYTLPVDDCWGELMSLGFGPPPPPGVPPFSFDFYGNTYLSCVIGANGLISFDPSVQTVGTVTASNYNFCQWSYSASLPSSSLYKNCIMGPYHDIHFGYGGSMYFQSIGEYPCRKLVLSFYQVPLYDCTSSLVTNMIVLYETTNTIEFYMQNKPFCSTWNGGRSILGIQNANATESTVVSNYNSSTQWSATNEAWRIRPEGNLNYWTEWYNRPASGGATIPIESNDDYQTVANPTSADGPQWYIMKTTITRLDARQLIYFDSCLVMPIDLDPFIITHNNRVGYNDTICMGSNMNISLEGGNYYRMISPTYQDIVDPNSIVVSPSVSTTYIFEVDNHNDDGQRICTRVDSIRVHPRSFGVAISANEMTICKSDTIKLWNTNEEEVVGSSLWYYANSAISYDDTLSYTPQNSGLIYYKLTDNFSCEAKDSIYVTVNEAPIVTLSGDTNICLGKSTSLTASSSLPNCTYLWSTGQTSATISTRPVVEETEYEVSVKFGASQCETIEKIIVKANRKPSVIASPDVNICYADSAQIYVTGDADSYFWKSNPIDANVENSNLKNLIVSPEQTTLYFAHGLSDIGCENIDTVKVLVHNLPVAQMSFNPAVIDDLDPTVIFSDETNGSVLRRWQLSDGGTSTESIFVHLFELSDTIQSYLINLYVENDAGCEDSTTNIIRISKTHFLWAPNTVYVYDTDPRVSQFRVYIDDPMEFELEIFNRWGERLFSTTNQEIAWNCKYKGEFVNQGTYVWVAKYRYAGKRNQVIQEKGSFTIYK